MPNIQEITPVKSPGLDQWRILSKGNGVNPDSRHPLADVFNDVLAQVTQGKGRERHGADAKGKELPFTEQPLMVLTRMVGEGYPLGQAMKKLSETQRLWELRGKEAAYSELLGAIAYAASAALYIRESSSKE